MQIWGRAAPVAAASSTGARSRQRTCRPVALAPAVPCTRQRRAPAVRVAAAAGAAAAPADGAPAAAGASPHWQQALAELDKPKEQRKLVVVQTAPAVRVAIAETLGLGPGEVTTGQMVAGLRKLGFDYVFDTLFAADLTIMEEGTELLHRLEAKAAERAGAPAPHEHASSILPMFTSCCPGWVQMVEKSNPELIPFLSTCKSPQMMMGAVLKDYFAAHAGVKAEDVVSVSVMPCVRKQGEADRDWFVSEGATGAVRDVDHVITTAELGKIFTERGISLKDLPEEEYDNPLGTGSGGGVLFGTTGGVMEAALRTVYELVSGQPMERIAFEPARGLDGIKEATVTIPVAADSPYAPLEASPGGGISLRIAVANGLGNAKKVIKGVAEGSAPYDFVEVMACPGGCIGGGGQPRSADKGILAKRQAAMYGLDERSIIRRSHENPAVLKLYKDWLGKPNSHLAHDKLHTHYVPGGAEGGADNAQQPGTMAAQGAALQTSNNELVKCIEDLREKREGMLKQIADEEAEKQKIQGELSALSKRLAAVNESLARKLDAKNEYDRVIAETEGAYLQILQSSQTLLTVLKREAVGMQKRTQRAT